MADGASDDCLTDERIAALVEGSLAAEARAEAERHLARCAGCRRLASELCRLEDPATAATQPTGVEPGTPATPAAGLVAGDRVGRYLIERPIGAGGMGIVYAAHDPELDRRIAIKILRAEVVAADGGPDRLRAEARALARLEHPNVVRIYDVGVADGRAYLAMEYVDGEDLATFASRQRRSGSALAILEVGLAAARGLAAAHAAGLVHRDVKPSNVLVARDGRAMMVDFGLTRPGAAPGAPPTASTAAGTPAYAAPEQAAGLASDARSDQYSFCVALREVLGGEPPDGSGARPRRGVTSRLAGRLAPILARGSAPDPTRRYPSMVELIAALDGIRQRRRRLTALAVGLACLTLGAGLAVGARLGAVSVAPTTLCRGGEARVAATWPPATDAAVASRFLATTRRGRAAVHAAVAVALGRYRTRWVGAFTAACEATYLHGEQSAALLDRRMRCLDRGLTELGALGRAWSAPLGDAAIDRAIDAVEALPAPAACGDPAILNRPELAPPPAAERAVVERLRAGLAAARARSFTSGGAEVELGRLLDQARGLHYRPLAIELASTLGQLVMDRDGLAAKPLWREVLDRASAIGDDFAIADASLRLFLIATQTERDLDAARTLEPLVAVAVERSGSAEARAGFDLARASLRAEEGHPEEAAVACARARATYQDALARGELTEVTVHRALTRVEHSCVEFEITLGRLDQARRLLDLADAHLAAAVPPGHPDHADAALVRGRLLDQTGDFAGALASYRAAGALRVALYGRDDLEALTASLNAGIALTKLGRLDEASAELEPALARSRTVKGDDDLTTLRLLGALANVELARGRFAAAQPLLERAIAGKVATLGPDHPTLVVPLNNLGNVMADRGDLDGAEAHYRRSLALAETVGPRFPDVALPLNNLGELALARGRFADAAALCRRANAIDQASLGAEHPDLAYTLTCLARAEVGRGQLGEARRLAERALALRTGDAEPVEKAQTLFALARALPAAARARARTLATEARDLAQGGRGARAEALQASIARWLER